VLNYYEETSAFLKRLDELVQLVVGRANLPERINALVTVQSEVLAQGHENVSLVRGNPDSIRFWQWWFDKLASRVVDHCASCGHKWREHPDGLACSRSGCLCEGLTSRDSAELWDRVIQGVTAHEIGHLLNQLDGDELEGDDRDDHRAEFAADWRGATIIGRKNMLLLLRVMQFDVATSLTHPSGPDRIARIEEAELPYELDPE
jgi:hypothetical protein